MSHELAMPGLKQARISSEPLNHASLILLGYDTPPGWNYYFYPGAAGSYRLEYVATVYQGREPVAGTEQWRAFIPYGDEPTIRRFNTLGELNYFHKGMTDQWLF